MSHEAFPMGRFEPILGELLCAGLSQEIINIANCLIEWLDTT